VECGLNGVLLLFCFLCFWVMPVLLRACCRVRCGYYRSVSAVKLCKPIYTETMCNGYSLNSKEAVFS